MCFLSAAREVRVKGKVLRALWTNLCVDKSFSRCSELVSQLHLGRVSPVEPSRGSNLTKL